MSQAVCAPSTGDICVAPGNMPIATAASAGKGDGVSPSRRGLLAGLMLAPALAGLMAGSSEAVEWEDPVLLSRRADAAFWNAHDKLQRLARQWTAAQQALRGSPRYDAVNGNWCARHSLAETKMMLTPVTTLPALYAKMEAAQKTEMEWAEPLLSGHSPLDHVMFDLNRIIMRGYRQ